MVVALPEVLAAIASRGGTQQLSDRSSVVGGGMMLGRKIGLISGPKTAGRKPGA